MAKHPIHKTIQNLLQYYLSLYYLIRENNPNLRLNEKKHISEIERLERAYHKDIYLKYPQWDTEENKAQLKKDIDFLTQVFTRQEQERQKQQSINELKESIKKPQHK